MFIDYIFLSLENRDIAIIICILTGFSILIFKKNFRKTTFHLLRTVTNLKIFLIFGFVLSYVSLEIFILNFFNLWENIYIPHVFFWFFTDAIYLILKNEEYFSLKKEIGRIFCITVFIGLLVNFYSFHILIEILFILIIFFSYIIGYNEKYQNISKKVLLIIFLTMLAWSIYNLSINPSLLIDSTYGLFLITLLGIGYIPFLYIMLIYLRYEFIFSLINFNYNKFYSDSPKEQRIKLKIKIIRENFLKLNKLNNINGIDIVKMMKNDKNIS